MTRICEFPPRPQEVFLLLLVEGLCQYNLHPGNRMESLWPDIPRTFVLDQAVSKQEALADTQYKRFALDADDPISKPDY